MIIPSKTGKINGGNFVANGRSVRPVVDTCPPPLIESRASQSNFVSHRVLGLPAAVVGAILVIVATLLGGATNPASANSSWTSTGGGWAGSGSVYLPGGSHVGGSSSQGSSACLGCTWAVAPMCKEGILDPCETLAPFQPCAAGEIRYTINFGQGGAAPSYYSNECIGSGERPVSSVEVDRLVHDRVRQLAPSLSFDFQPSSRPVTQIPTLFRVGQPNEVSRTDSIAGFSVRMRAEVKRVWQWGDGTSKRTNLRGGRWPDTSLSHTYRTAGTQRVRLTANWTAEYSVQGGRWVQVDGDPIQQSISRTLRVREARAQLVQ